MGTPTTHAQNSFNAGEWSARMEGRTDLGANEKGKFQNACRIIKNFLGQPQGGLIRRSGTRHVAQVKFPLKRTRLYEFEFSVDVAYVMEVGDLYIRFYKDEAQVTESVSVVSGTESGGTAVVNIGTHQVQVGDHVTFAGNTPSQYNGDKLITARTASTVSFAMTTGPGSITVTGTAAVPFEVVAPWADTNLDKLRVTQSADFAFFSHPDFQTRELARGATDILWTIALFVPKDGPYFPENVTATTIALSAMTGAVTATASSIVGINNGAGFKTTDVGRIFRWRDDANNYTWLLITGFTSTTVVSATIIGPDTSSTGGRVGWSLGAWSDTTGWPHMSEFHQSRFFFLRTDTQTERIWGSKTEDIDNFAPTDPDGTVLDDSAINRSITNGKKIQTGIWMRSGTQGLLVGTIGSELVMRSKGQFDPITPATFNSFKQSGHGSIDDVEPAEANISILMVQRAGKKIREMVFSFDVDGYVAPDLTILAEHTTAISTVKEMKFQEEPFSTLYVILANGDLKTLTYERDQNVVAWQRQVLGGALSTGDPDVKALTIIPNAGEGQPWFIVERTINGATTQYVEFLEETYPIEGRDIEDGFFVDSGKTYSGSAVTTLTGYEHLIGQTVQILLQDGAHPDAVVSATGTIALTRSATKAQAGLGYVSAVEPLPMTPTRSSKDPRGSHIAVGDMFLRLHNTLGGKMGPGRDPETGLVIPVADLDDIIYRDDADEAAPDIFSGLKKIDPDVETDRDITIQIVQDQPLPMNILAWIIKLHVEDR